MLCDSSGPTSEEPFHLSSVADKIVIHDKNPAPPAPIAQDFDSPRTRSFPLGGDPAVQDDNVA